MNEKIKTLQIIHFGLCSGVLIAYFVLGKLFEFENINFPKIDSESIVYLLISFGAIFLSNFLYKQKLKAIDNRLTFEEKMPLYQSAFIVRMAILEGAAFMILILKKELIVLGLLLIAYMIFIRPTLDKIKNELI